MNAWTWRRPIEGTAILLAAALPALVLHGAAQVAPGAAPRLGPRTGMIVGQVVDASTGQGIGEAVVRLALSGYPEGQPDSPNDTVMADADGRFFFTGLPAGDYYLQATKHGFIRGVHGQRQPWGQSQSLSLGDGERRTDVELRVWKYAVIGGTVVDEAGEPVVGIAVRALVKGVFAGRTQYGNRQVIPELVPIAVTDDRGMFRLSQLSPGSYVVVVPSTHTTVPAASLQAPDARLRNELFWGGVQEMSALGQPRTLQMDDFALMTLNRVLIPPPPTSSGRMQVYRTTYYPAAARPGAATAVAVNSGEERTDLTISLRPMPGVRVSGRLVAPDGSVPPRTTIRLVGEAMADVITTEGISGPDHVGLDTATGLSDGSGRFALIGVPPGDYVLTQADRFLSRYAREGRQAYWVSQPITVGSEDVTGLTVELRPALRVEGRVEFRGGDAQHPPRARGVTFETPHGESGQFAVEIAADTSSFSTVAAGGQYIVRPYTVAGWVLRSVTLDGKDITDRAFDLQTDTTSLVITFTDRATKVSGTVTDARGAASATAVVLAFPVDRQRWSGYGASPMALGSALTTRDGVYSFAHLPPGDYYVVAVEAVDADGWQDPATLEALASGAAKLSIAASDSLETLDLRVRTLR